MKYIPIHLIRILLKLLISWQMTFIDYFPSIYHSLFQIALTHTEFITKTSTSINLFLFLHLSPCPLLLMPRNSQSLFFNNTSYPFKSKRVFLIHLGFCLFFSLCSEFHLQICTTRKKNVFHFQVSDQNSMHFETILYCSRQIILSLPPCSHCFSYIS